MARKLFTLSVVICVMAAFLVIPVQAAKRAIDPMETYRFEVKPRAAIANEEGGPVNSTSQAPAQLGSLGATDEATAIGFSFGFTWYDLQQNSTMHRTIDWRSADNAGAQLHMGWTFGPTQDVSVATGVRTAAYYAFDLIAGQAAAGPSGCSVFDYNTFRAGYVSMDVRPVATDPTLRPSATMAFHRTDALGSEDFFTYIAYDDADATLGYCVFASTGHFQQVDSLDEVPYEPITCDNEHYIWPKVEYHINGSDTFSYALAMPNCGTQPIVFFRVAGTMGGANGETWESELMTDVTNFPIHTLAASRVSKKVAVFYIIGANPTNPSVTPGNVIVRESGNMGAPGSWSSEINVSSYDWEEPGYRAYLEGAVLYTQPDDNLHVLWPAFYTNQGASLGVNNECRIFHWTDKGGNAPGENIATVHSAEWDANETCGNISYNSLNVRAANISQCNDKLYAIWVQAQNPPDIVDNCANEDEVGRFDAGAGDLYMSVSQDLDGAAWDAARNLTNTIVPGCDSALCYSENWPSISRYGMNMADFASAIGPPAEALEVQPDPAGTYTGTWYLDVMYVEDKFPGWGSANPQDTKMCRNPMRWFRLPCVDIVPEANPLVTPSGVEYPYILNHGQADTVEVEVLNAGTNPMTATAHKVEDVGASSVGTTGWLDFDQTSFSLGVGTGNRDTMEVILNVGGIINNPGTVVNLIGRVVLDVDEPTTRDSVSFDVDLIIADTLVTIDWDTVATATVRLAVSNQCEIGQNNGIDGTVGMDFVWAGIDCDTQVSQTDTFPGASRRYLYDASPIVLQDRGLDTVGSWSIFQQDLGTPVSLRPIPDPGQLSPGLLADTVDAVSDGIGWDVEAHWSGVVVTADSNITLEQTTYFPQAAGGFTSTDWVAVRVAMYSTDGSAIQDWVPGYAWDWDIPSDTGVNNTAAILPSTGGDYYICVLTGSEYNDPDESECIDNNRRHGGSAYIGYQDGSTSGLNATHVPRRFYSALNTTFNSGAVYGFDAIQIWNYIVEQPTDMTVSSADDDHHMMCAPFRDTYTLSANDTLVMWYIMATIYDGAVTDLQGVTQEGRDWVVNNYPLPYRPLDEGCCGIYDPAGLTGNWTRDEENVKDLSDILGIASYAFLGGAISECSYEGNVSGDAGCVIDLSDVLALAQYAFLGGALPAECDIAWPCPE